MSSFLGFPLFPEQASTMAPRVDTIFYFLIAFSAFFASLICIVIIIFAVKYRRRSNSQHTPVITEGDDPRLEIVWTVIPFIFIMIFFVWGARLFFITFHPPADALQISIVGKQWMWKVQHPEGAREIDELHVPLGQPVKLLLTSQDVIHDFFVPAFRIKTDVVPGRYTTFWFEASKAGEYRLVCSQYCGTQHSGMIGRVVVMTAPDYQKWLSGAAGVSMAETGAQLFQTLGCISCHTESDTARGPSLIGLFGRTVKLQSGNSQVADENYVRESIVNPQAKLVAGYQPVMPTFQGLISEEGILQILAYVKSLNGGGEGTQTKK